MNLRYSLITNLYTQLVLVRYNFKLRLLGLPTSQIDSHLGEPSSRDLWRGTSFPNYMLMRSPGFWRSRPNLASSPATASASKHQSKAYLHLTLNRQATSFYEAETVFNLTRAITLIWQYLFSLVLWVLNLVRRSFGEGLIYIRGLVILFSFDAMITDDEPLWEPVEWSLVQSWILFIFAFAWIAENLITSRYGSYTGRDKRVWAAWYKTFWMVEGWYVLSLGAAALFVITPFYHEISYSLPLVVSWWNWYSRTFFFRFVSTYTLLLCAARYLQLNIGSLHWRTSLLIILLINLYLLYMLYTHFLMTFFAYFTDPNWYSKTRLTDYVQLSHEPNKWSWGSAKRDHFSYHKSTTVLWFKNDGPFASALLLFHTLFFLCLFALYLYWLTLLRRVYATGEITYTYTTYCVSALHQFFYFSLLLPLLTAFSLVVQYWRLPIEQAWAFSTPMSEVILSELTGDYIAFFLAYL